MKSLTGITRYAFIAFFASHIPATLIIDSQAVMPQGTHPQIFQDLLSWYTTQFNDDLMRAPFEIWFKAFVYIEVLFQLPFFFYALYGLMFPMKVDGRGLYRSLCLVYGGHTSTTLVPILACHVYNQDTTLVEKIGLISIYLPYLIFPLWLVVICFFSDDVFNDKKIDKLKKR